MPAPEPAEAACLERTRSAVLNVLVAVGVGIAASGLLLRWRARAMPPEAPDLVRQGLMIGLLAVTVASYVLRRVLAGRPALRDPAGRCAKFYRGHVIAAAVGGLAIPLGLLYGWLVRPRLDAVAPFWVAALALGFLALPRAYELEEFDEPMTPSSEPRA
jgi:hypothetical protein